MDNGESLSEFLEESESFDDIFSILQALETGSDDNNNATAFVGSKDGEFSNESFEFQKSSHHHHHHHHPPSGNKRRKVELEVGPPRISHIAVERNRRKQMNDHLTVLRSLMPCFYVKRGDQASIIGGVISYVNELQQLVQALEAKKQRKQAYADVLSPRPSPKPPLSPRMIMSLPVSPRTPQPGSPYKPRLHNSFPTPPGDLSPCNSSTNDTVNELVATSNSALAQVEVKFCGPNLLLKTVSHRIPGQVAKIVSALEQLELEILQVNINIVDDRMLNSFTIKIGIECQLSAEELAQQIQQTFC